MSNLKWLPLCGGIFALTAVAPRAGAQRVEAPAQFIVSESWLVQHARDPKTVILDVEEDPREFSKGHIAGARLLTYGDIAPDIDGLMHQVAPVAALRQAFEKVGVSNDSHVIVYASDAPMAARAAFTLDYLGGVTVSFLDGGMAGWRAAGQAISTTTDPVTRGSYTPTPRPQVLADAAWIRAHQGNHGMSLIDTRTDGEYVGAGDRHGMPSQGHLSGAHQLQWQQLFSNPGASALLPHDSLAALYTARVSPGDTVVTYCFVAYRASTTYMIARALGYPVKLYDGSYEDWSRRKLPLVPGASPR